MVKLEWYRDGGEVSAVEDLLADAAEVDVEVLEDLGRDAAALLDDPEEDVLGADELAVEPLRLGAGDVHHFAGALGEFLKHCVSPCWGCPLYIY